MCRPFVLALQFWPGQKGILQSNLFSCYLSLPRNKGGVHMIHTWLESHALLYGELSQKVEELLRFARHLLKHDTLMPSAPFSVPL